MYAKYLMAGHCITVLFAFRRQSLSSSLSGLLPGANVTSPVRIKSLKAAKHVYSACVNMYTQYTT